MLITGGKTAQSRPLGMQVEEVGGYDQAEDDVPQLAYLVCQVTKCLCSIKMGDFAILQMSVI